MDAKAATELLRVFTAMLKEQKRTNGLLTQLLNNTGAKIAPPPAKPAAKLPPAKPAKAAGGLSFLRKK